MNRFPAGRNTFAESIATLARLHYGSTGYCVGTKDERGVCNICGEQLAPPPISDYIILDPSTVHAITEYIATTGIKLSSIHSTITVKNGQIAFDLQTADHYAPVHVTISMPEWLS